jgi:hypothetical protein
MPQGAAILHVAFWNAQLSIWVLVDTDGPVVDYRFRILGDDQDLSSFRFEALGEHRAVLRHLATVQSNFQMWHVFEERWIA